MLNVKLVLDFKSKVKFNHRVSKTQRFEHSVVFEDGNEIDFKIQLSSNIVVSFQG